MSYSIKIILHPEANKEGLHSIQIKLTYNNIRVYGKTDYKVSKSQFINGEIIKHANAKAINFNLKAKITGIESRLIDALKFTDNLSKEQLKAIIENRSFTPSKTVDSFVTEILRVNNFSEGRIKHYLSVKKKLLAFKEGLLISDIDVSFLQNFEAFLRLPDYNGKRLDTNTILTNIKIVKSIVNKASHLGLIENKLSAYKNPKYVQKIPEYLTEEEIRTFLSVTKTIPVQSIRLSGLYFLLSCYTGYRISDLYAFDQSKMVQNNMLTIRAKKNKQIVSIPIFEDLKNILDLINGEPLKITEQTMRTNVKEIAKLCGISRKIKVHSGRHTFGMLLASKGFRIEEAAELMGDSIEVVKIYYRINNSMLSKSVMEKFANKKTG